jgi:hypothetical protein
MKIRKKVSLGAAAALSILGIFGLAMPANAAAHVAPATVSTDGLLNPATYSGPMVVATPLGDVVVTVAAGTATQVAHRVQAAVANGKPAALNQLISPAVSCETWLNAVAGIDAYAASVQGCGVFGYPGYKRLYEYSNNSDVDISWKGQGYSATPTRTWYATCSAEGGDGCGHSVPWGNVLGTTRVEGKSNSIVTGGAYTWET